MTNNSSFVGRVVNAEGGASMAAAGLEEEGRGSERGTDLKIQYAKRGGI